MTATATQLHPNRIAVFGSVAAERRADPAEAERGLSPAAGAVLERVLESIACNASTIARPILDRAVDDGTITRDERHELLRELSEPSARSDDHAGAPASLAARRVLRESLAAIRRAAPGIAQPILDQAVDAERLTAAQEQRILERLRISPSRTLRGPAPRSPLPAGG
jgi:hypothetical protein